MAAIRGRNQLGRHADPVACPAHAPFEHVGHAERLRDVAHILILALERERRSARDHFQSLDLRQRIDDFFSEAVTEVFVLPVSAQIGKRQHRDRRRRIGGPNRQVVQGVPDVGHRLESAVGILGEAALDDLLQRRRRIQRARIVAQHGAEDLCRGVAREGPGARKQFIQHGPEAEYVRPRVERLGCRLFGGHVRWCSHHGRR